MYTFCLLWYLIIIPETNTLNFPISVKHCLLAYPSNYMINCKFNCLGYFKIINCSLCVVKWPKDEKIPM